jgi:hypothetical protein
MRRTYGMYETEQTPSGFWWGKPKGKKPLGRPKCRWEDNINMELQEVGLRVMDWIGLTRNRDRWWRLANVGMNLGFHTM